MFPSGRFSAARRGLLAAGLVCGVFAAPLPAYAHAQISMQLEELNEEIAHHPHDAELYIARGELHRKNRAWELAEWDYLKAESLEPDSPLVHFYLGRMWLESGRPESASRALDRFLAVQPDNVAALVIRARALAAMGERLAAVDDYDKVIAGLDSPAPEHFLERARLLAAEGGAYHDAGLRGIDDALARFGPLVSLIDLAIDLEVGRGRTDAALARLANLPPALLDRPSWLARRGDILHAAGREDVAIEAYREALAAIDALPAKRRSAKASIALEARLRDLLARNESAVPLQPPAREATVQVGHARP